MSAPNQKQDDDWDAAVTARLRRLQALPIDVTPFEQALAAGPVVVKRRLWWPRSFAAGLIIFAALVLSVILFASTGPVYAQPSEIAAMHRELISGQGEIVRVSSVDDVKRVLASEWKHAPELPNMPEKRVMAFCIRKMDAKKVACILLSDGDAAVSMMVADCREVKNSRSSTVTDKQFQTESSGELNMVMTKQDGRWVCLIGEQPVERLVTLSKSLQY